MIRIALYLLAVLSTSTVSAAVPAGDVRLTETEDTAVLANNEFALKFRKSDGSLRSLAYHGRELIGPGQGYVQIALGAKKREHAQWSYRVCRNDPHAVEIAFTNVAADMPFDMETHYILRADEPGFHNYLTLGHDARRSPGVITMAQYNFCLRADPRIFNYAAVDDRRIDLMPSCAAMAAAKPVMDATYRLADGRIYSKYFYSATMDENHLVHGLIGNGLGLWIIMPSHEHLNGGPEHQELTVHQTDRTPVLLAHFNAAHYGAGELVSDARDGSWSKASAPWFVYVNAADEHAADWREIVWRDAKARARSQSSQWPYAWLDDGRFQLHRGNVSGTVLLDDGQPAADARVILAEHEQQPLPLGWQQQWRGYRFYSRTDAQGRFSLEKVRPGRYDLYAWNSGLFGQFYHDDLRVEPDKTLRVGTLSWPLPKNRQTLWRIGIPNRSAAEFGDADDFRRWGLWDSIARKHQDDLTFTIGRDNDRHWPFEMAVTQADDRSWRVPRWEVRFENTTTRRGQATLTLAIAGFESMAASLKTQMTISLNRQEIGNIHGLQSDSSAHRSGASGLYQQRELSFDAGILNRGTNRLGIELVAPSRPVDYALGRPASAVLWDCLQLDVQGPANGRSDK